MSNYHLIFNYFIYSFMGVILTVFNVLIGCNEVVASSLTGIILALAAITMQDENRGSWGGFAGSFAGMTAVSYLGSSDTTGISISLIISVVLLGLLFAALYSFSEIISLKYPGLFFDGYGGRLGTIAFLSVLVFLGLRYIIKPFHFAAFRPDIVRYYTDPMYYFAIISAFTAAMISMEIKNAVSSLNENYKVLSVAITGIIGGVLITKIPLYGNEFAAAWYTGAFVGMSSYFILMLKRNYFISGVIAGILFIIFRPFLTGVGGKLGFISFIAVLSMKGIGKFYGIIIEKANRQRFLNTDNIASSPDLMVNDDYAQKLVESLLAGNQIPGSEDSQSQSPVEEFLVTHGMYSYGIIRHDPAGNWQSYGSMIINTHILTPESGFITTLSREKRILVYSHRGLQNAFFKALFTPENLDESVTFGLIIPVFSGFLLKEVYIVLLHDKDQQYCKSLTAELKKLLI